MKTQYKKFMAKSFKKCKITRTFKFIYLKSRNIYKESPYK